MVFGHGEWAHEEHTYAGTVGVGASAVATPHINPKPHTIEWMRNGQKKWRVFWAKSGNTHKRHGVSTGKPVALVGGKMD